MKKLLYGAHVAAIGLSLSIAPMVRADGFEDLFSHPATDAALPAQVTLAIGELATAAGIYKLAGGRSNLSPEIAAKVEQQGKVLGELEKSLEGLGKTIAQKDEKIGQAFVDKGLAEWVTHPDGKALHMKVMPKSELEKVLHELTVADHYAERELLKSIAKAQGEIASVRGEMLKLAEKAAPAAKKPSKFIKGLRVVGPLILLADVGSRVYVWNAYEKNPGYFPLGQLAYGAGKKLTEGANDFLVENGITIEAAKEKLHSAGQSAGKYKERMDKLVYPNQETHK